MGNPLASFQKRAEEFLIGPAGREMVRPRSCVSFGRVQIYDIQRKGVLLGLLHHWQKQLEGENKSDVPREKAEAMLSALKEACGRSAPHAPVAPSVQRARRRRRRQSAPPRLIPDRQTFSGTFSLKKDMVGTFATLRLRKQLKHLADESRKYLAADESS